MVEALCANLAPGDRWRRNSARGMSYQVVPTEKKIKKSSMSRNFKCSSNIQITLSRRKSKLNTGGYDLTRLKWIANDKINYKHGILLKIWCSWHNFFTINWESLIAFFLTFNFRTDFAPPATTAYSFFFSAAVRLLHSFAAFLSRLFLHGLVRFI